MGLDDEGGFGFGTVLGCFFVHALGDELRLEFGHLLAICLVEGYVIVADEVVALLAARGGRFTVAKLLPGQHGLADMDAAVVDDVGLDHAVAVGLGNLCNGPAEQVVAHMAQVKGLIGVGRGILNHHQGRRFRRSGQSVARISIDVAEQGHPAVGGNGQVEESLHHVEGSHHAAVVHQILAYFLGRVFGLLARHFQVGEDNEREMAFKLALGLLQLYRICGHLLSVEVVESGRYAGRQLLFNLHRLFCMLTFIFNLQI